LLAILLFFIGAGALYYFSTKELAVTDADRALIVGPHEIKPYFSDYEPVSTAIKYSKVRYIDGQVELAMEYDVEADDQPYMSVVVTDSVRQSDNLGNYVVAWNAMVAVFNAYDTKYEIIEDNDAFHIGDRSRFAYVKYEDAIVGNMLVFMSGKKLYELTLTGFYIEQADIWQELFANKIELLKLFNRQK